MPVLILISHSQGAKETALTSKQAGHCIATFMVVSFIPSQRARYRRVNAELQCDCEPLTRWPMTSQPWVESHSSSTGETFIWNDRIAMAREARSRAPTNRLAQAFSDQTHEVTVNLDPDE